MQGAQQDASGPERFPPMERGPGSIETRGDVVMALMRIDEQLHHNRNRGLVDWPFKPLSRVLRRIVAHLEAADAPGGPEDWPDSGSETAAIIAALKKALRERTPVAYFAYGAINHSGGFHSRGNDENGHPHPNRPGWFYFEAEHGQWAGPFPTEEQARAESSDFGDE